MPAVKTEVQGKKKQQKPDEMFLPIVYYHYEVNKGFGKKEPVTVPIFDKHAFITQQEVIAYLPFYVSELIKKGDLPKDVIKKDADGREYLDETMVKTGFEVLHLSTLDLSPSDE